MTLPDRVLFIDVETTGLARWDRVVSLGFIELLTPGLDRGEVRGRFGHYIFDPGRKSHPQAERIHGFCDWTLRHQERFEVRATDLKPLFDGCGLIVAHSIEFDMRFISREFRKSGVGIVEQPRYCTMNGYRSRHQGAADLDSAVAASGIAIERAQHNALEDAWLAMQLFLWLHGLPRPAQQFMLRHPPANWREPPPRPNSKIPRRKHNWRAGDAGPNMAVSRWAAIGPHGDGTPVNLARE